MISMSVHREGMTEAFKKIYPISFCSVLSFFNGFLFLCILPLGPESPEDQSFPDFQVPPASKKENHITAPKELCILPTVIMTFTVQVPFKISLSIFKRFTHRALCLDLQWPQPIHNTGFGVSTLFRV